MPPARITFSRIRSPKTPLRQTMTLSQGSIRLTKQASIPALPGAEIGMVKSFSLKSVF